MRMKKIENILKAAKMNVSKPVIARLALLIWGIIKAKCFIISEIARELVSDNANFPAIRKRITRFLRSFNCENIIEEWAEGVLAKIRGRRIYIAIDYTRMPVVNMDFLFASAIADGRAIPIYFWILTDFWIDVYSQNIFEIEFVKRLLSLLPGDKRLVIIADRGFAKGMVIKVLKNIPRASFVIRICGDTGIILKNGRKIIKDIPLIPKRAKHFKVLYGYKHKIPVNLSIYMDKGMDEPWYIIDNLRRKGSGLEIYRHRFMIEEGFRDIKNEIAIKKIRIPVKMKKERFIQFLVIYMIGYYILYGIGVINRDLIKHIVEERKGRRIVSFSFAAMRLVKMAIEGRILKLRWRGIMKVFSKMGRINLSFGFT